MKKVLITLILTVIVVLTPAQTSKLIGSWLMTKVEIGDKLEAPYFITDFNKDGKMVIMGIEAGTWEFDKKEKKIVMKSKLDKDFNGESKVLKLNKKELIVSKDGAKLYYIKVKQKEINEVNANSNFKGIWKIELKDAPESWQNETHFFKFELPNNFVAISDENGAESKYKGTWIYNPKEKTIIIIGRLQSLRGKSSIKRMSLNELELKNKEIIFKAKKIEIDSNSIEHLSFTYEDFHEEDYQGDFPWYFEEMVTFLANINCLKYKKGKLIEEFNVFEYQTIISKIEVNTNEQNVMFSNLAVIEGDTTQFSQNHKGGLSESYNDFFPKKKPWPYRVLANQTVTVSAGTFNCTVIEGFDGDSDNKIKYWMINDKPGIYAKVIIEGEGVFGDLEYNVLELEKIK